MDFIKNLFNQKTPAIETFDKQEIENTIKGWNTSFTEYKTKKSIENRVSLCEKFLEGKADELFNSVRTLRAYERRKSYNLIFENYCIFNSMATKGQPEPIVTLDDQPIADWSKFLQYIANENNLRGKAKDAIIQWHTKSIACLKTTYDTKSKTYKINPVKSENLILDPQGYVEDGQFIGQFIGEKINISSKKLIAKFPEQEALIKNVSQNGKNLTYIEWHDDENIYFTLNGRLLDYFRTPYYNFAKEQTVMDEFGNEQIVISDGVNYFEEPHKPYSFLSIFGDGSQPLDLTNLIYQSIDLQDEINTLTYQIQANANRCNGFMVIRGFEKRESEDIVNMVHSGGAINIEEGTEADKNVVLNTGVALPSFVFDTLMMKMDQMRNLWGTRGSSAAGIQSERLATGKVMIQQQDGDRMTMVTEALEKLYKHTFELLTQLHYVYQSQGATNYTYELETPKDIQITVKPGSLMPKSPLMLSNQMADLWNMGAVDALTMFEKMDFANPQEMYDKYVLFKANPNLLASEEVQQQLQPAQTPPIPPKISTNFKDLSPGEQDQVLQMNNIQPESAGISLSEQELLQKTN